MDTFFYFLFVIAYISLLVWAVYSSSQNLSYRSFLFLVITGLVYDNALLAFGRFIGAGELLETLNAARYWIHAIVTPTLVLYCYGILKLLNIEWVNSNKGKMVFYYITLLLIAIELIIEVIPLNLKPVWENGVLNYAPVTANNHPPYMILAVTVILLVTSIILCKKTKWKWMLIGTVLMGAGSAAAPLFPSGALTNGFELILIFTLVITKIYIERKKTLPFLGNNPKKAR
ncbi:hypothetical protein SAMN04487944_10623 [Gracilibacillus ureilyticus]|uniref:Phospholipid phosphatase n=1 Tax=Gracilibacillus ureilyticus TaxID=531814 RepID=A0A1H9Q3N9_9BACI|nr:hypothetical protein [Gracilibacillus ureilyticus]SER55196.1 hypothetical protein SAMN04487944_10623 [Gracilibacillus ureilyticus]